MTDARPGSEVDFFGDEAILNPYEFYAELREQANPPRRAPASSSGDEIAYSLVERHIRVAEVIFAAESRYGSPASGP